MTRIGQGALIGVVVGGLSAGVVHAESRDVTIRAIDAGGVGKPVGEIIASDGNSGLLLNVRLRGIPPGQHGFHVHENGDCGPKVKGSKPGAGLAAGGHYDPNKSGKHAGPKGQGHLGDLPLLRADQEGSVNTEVVAPRLTVADLRGRALMIHAGGDNYADQPKPLGGGGARIACGVVPG